LHCPAARSCRKDGKAPSGLAPEAESRRRRDDSARFTTDSDRYLDPPTGFSAQRSGIQPACARETIRQADISARNLSVWLKRQFGPEAGAEPTDIDPATVGKSSRPRSSRRQHCVDGLATRGREIDAERQPGRSTRYTRGSSEAGAQDW